jgi:hypothetical protein
MSLSLRRKERPPWNHVIIEGYCMRGLSCERYKYNYRVIDMEHFPWQYEKVENPCYNPKYRVPKRPKYCKKKICYICLENGCPHFGYSDCEEDELEKIMEFIDEMYKDD